MGGIEGSAQQPYDHSRLGMGKSLHRSLLPATTRAEPAPVDEVGLLRDGSSCRVAGGYVNVVTAEIPERQLV